MRLEKVRHGTWKRDMRRCLGAVITSVILDCKSFIKIYLVLAKVPAHLTAISF